MTNTRSLANLKPFKKGEGGRPKGARNKLGEEFLNALYVDFQEHGAEAIVRVREDKPDAYLKVIASLLPRQIDLTEAGPLEELTDDQLTRLILDLKEAEQAATQPKADEGHRH
ncbi:hypothetical protein [Aquabacter cavernae]|uniref:hypothetical protein n=1 Tax=Aquabacter cavernae TaxID=2496029 RepID=UPI000F8C5A48|nr:hypothetical protein [Aquabacter cavernae]